MPPGSGGALSDVIATSRRTVWITSGRVDPAIGQGGGQVNRQAGNPGDNERDTTSLDRPDIGGGLSRW